MFKTKQQIINDTFQYTFNVQYINVFVCFRQISIFLCVLLLFYNSHHLTMMWSVYIGILTSTMYIEYKQIFLIFEVFNRNEAKSKKNILDFSFYFSYKISLEFCEMEKSARLDLNCSNFIGHRSLNFGSKIVRGELLCIFFFCNVHPRGKAIIILNINRNDVITTQIYRISELSVVC